MHLPRARRRIGAGLAGLLSALILASVAGVAYAISGGGIPSYIRVQQLTLGFGSPATVLTNCSGTLCVNGGGVGPKVCLTGASGACDLTGFAVGQTAIVFKKSDQSATSNASPAIDTDLQFANAPIGDYVVALHLNYGLATTTTQGISWYVKAADASGFQIGECYITGGSNGTSNGVVGEQFEKFTTATYAGSVVGNTPTIDCSNGIMQVTTAGTIALYWAQASNSANATNVFGWNTSAWNRSSFLELTRVN